MPTLLRVDSLTCQTRHGSDKVCLFICLEVSDGEMNASNTAWKLLEVLLAKHEAPGMTTLHKAVLNCLLLEGFFPPLFLLSSYKHRNPAELMGLLLHAGRLREAANTALEYLAAMLGTGSEYFGGCKQLLAGQPTCLPWQTLDQLVEELDRPKYQQVNTCFIKAGLCSW